MHKRAPGIQNIDPKCFTWHQHFTTRFACIFSKMFEHEFKEDKIQGPLAPPEMAENLGAFASSIWIHGNPFLLKATIKNMLIYN